MSIALLAPSTAFGQDAREGYGYDVLGEIQTIEPQPGRETSETPPSSPPTQTSGSLPFTGADIGLVAGLGVLLLAAGVGLRRVRVNS
ncbi:MAG TPA: hypothetical protein VGW10_14885 [Solirubrobacteraceae bacterium]|nr:hypothetical protein [Solirubrobacteraceae bacterium]